MKLDDVIDFAKKKPLLACGIASLFVLPGLGVTLLGIEAFRHYTKDTNAPTTPTTNTNQSQLSFIGKVKDLFKLDKIMQPSPYNFFNSFGKQAMIGTASIFAFSALNAVTADAPIAILSAAITASASATFMYGATNLIGKALQSFGVDKLFPKKTPAKIQRVSKYIGAASGLIAYAINPGLAITNILASAAIGFFATSFVNGSSAAVIAGKKIVAAVKDMFFRKNDKQQQSAPAAPAVTTAQGRNRSSSLDDIYIPRARSISVDPEEQRAIHAAAREDFARQQAARGRGR